MACKEPPNNMTKTCTRCKEVKPLSLFSTVKKRNNAPSSWCKTCSNIASQLSYEKNKPKHLATGLRTRKKFLETPLGRSSSLVTSARGRAKLSGVPVTITKEWVLPKMLLGVCEVTGIKLDISSNTMGSGVRPPFGPSLDQILPGMGYTPENTQLVCWMYNNAKGTYHHEDVVTLAKAVLHVQ